MKGLNSGMNCDDMRGVNKSSFARHVAYVGKAKGYEICTLKVIFEFRAPVMGKRDV